MNKQNSFDPDRREIGPASGRHEHRRGRGRGRAGRRIVAAGGAALLCTGALVGFGSTPAQATDGTCAPVGETMVCTFVYTGASQSWAPPAGVSQLTFSVYGAEGGTPSWGGGSAGKGGKVSITRSIPDANIYTGQRGILINVGGKGSNLGGNGGWNGGGFADSSGSGGGASDVSYIDPIGGGEVPHAGWWLPPFVVAGGGGGGATNGNTFSPCYPHEGYAPGGYGGDGGGAGGTSGGGGAGMPVNDSGNCLPIGASGAGGGGGSSSSAGSGGSGGFVTGGSSGDAGQSASGRNGGQGGHVGGSYNPSLATGGGGGGGYYGGGGGGAGAQITEPSPLTGYDAWYGAGGGGGGSNWANPASGTNISSSAGVRSGNGLVEISYPLNTWAQLPVGGNTIASAPAVSNRGTNGGYARDIFALDSSGNLIHQFVTSNATGSAENLGKPSGSVALTGTPAAVSWGNSSDRIDAFARGSDNALWHKSYTSSGGWSGWDSLGGTLTCDPTVSSWGSGRLDVFTCDTSNHLAHKYWNGSSWSSWEGGATIADYGQTLTSAPAAVSWGSGRIDVFARDTNNNLIQKVYDSGAGGWQNYSQNGWYNLGGTLTSAPTVTSQASVSLDIYTRNSTNGLSHLKYRTSTGWQWSTPTVNSGAVDSPNNTPVATGSTPNDGYNFTVARDTNNGLKYIYLLD